MSITWSDLPGLSDYLVDNGYMVADADGVYKAFALLENDRQGEDIDVAAQALIDAYNPLTYVRSIKNQEIKDEGLSRVQVVFPAITGFDDLQIERERYLSIAPAARSATTDYQKMIDIYVAGANAITQNNLEADWSVVDTYNPVTGPSWPA